ncbi:MAG: methyltransferase domain-containing protein [Patescibacteria group bacterium]
MKKTKSNVAQNSWGEVSDWYEELLSNPKSYQSQVILPNLKRLLNLKQSDNVLDLACGEGFFPAQFEDSCFMTGLDIAPELISLAKNKCKKSELFVCSAEKMNTINVGQFDKIYTVLAIQNIKGLNETFENVANSLKPNGEWILVLNHPCFRQLRNSEWFFDKNKNIQYRMLSKYMSSYKEEIIMNPSKSSSKKTLTYHRPLQEYIKVAKSNGLSLVNMEEWISHIKQDTTYKENARKEFPLFMTLVFKKNLY